MLHQFKTVGQQTDPLDTGTGAIPNIRHDERCLSHPISHNRLVHHERTSPTMSTVTKTFPNMTSHPSLLLDLRSNLVSVPSLLIQRSHIIILPNDAKFADANAEISHSQAMLARNSDNQSVDLDLYSHTAAQVWLMARRMRLSMMVPVSSTGDKAG